jgi:hypothetical protein
MSEITQGFHPSDFPKIQKRVRYIDNRVKEVLGAEKWTVKKGEIEFQTCQIKQNQMSGWFEIKYEINHDILKFDLVVEFRACCTPIRLISKIQDKEIAECRSKKDFNSFWGSLESKMENDLTLTILDKYIREAGEMVHPSIREITKYDKQYRFNINDPKIDKVTSDANKVPYGYSIRNFSSIAVKIDFDNGVLKIDGPMSLERKIMIGDPEIVKTLVSTINETFDTAIQTAIDKDLIDKFTLRGADKHLKVIRHICNTLGRNADTSTVLSMLDNFRKKVENF